MKYIRSAALIAATAAALTALAPSAPAFAQAAKGKCVIAWSHYVGWEPIQYMQDSGILAKWSKKYGVDISITEPMGYGDSISQFAADQFCALSVTNMDALIGPASGGIPTRFIVTGDTSHGNDGLACKSATPMSVKDVKGRTVLLVEGTVSHYGLARWLKDNGLGLKDVTVKNVKDENLIVGAFQGSPADTCVVTWKPFLDDVRLTKGVKMVIDSSNIPGEIIDGIVVNDNPKSKYYASENVRKAIVGAWYEVTAIMAEKGTAENKKAIELMAKSSGPTVTVDAYYAQLKTTNLFYQPKDAVAFTSNQSLKRTMTFVRDFSFENGLLGSAKSASEVGIQFPDSSVLGGEKNIRLIFDTTYMQMAADGKL